MAQLACVEMVAADEIGRAAAPGFQFSVNHIKTLQQCWCGLPMRGFPFTMPKSKSGYRLCFINNV